jgi:hypothetical protein
MAGVSTRIVVLVFPVVAAVAVVAAIVAGEAVGSAPFSAGLPRNAAEAAAAGDVVSLMRFLRAGADPHRVDAVAPELISVSIRFASAIEAAILSRRGSVVSVLAHHGSLGDEAQRRALSCLAQDVGQADLAAVMASGDVPCAPGEALARVQARSAAAR